MSNKLAVLLTLIILLCYTSCQDAKYVHGQRSYQQYCADCHMDDGSGVADLYPELLSSATLGNYKNIPCIIRDGVTNSSSLIKMIGYPKMTDVDITNIVNYITYDLHNDSSKELLLRDVQALLTKCENP